MPQFGATEAYKSREERWTACKTILTKLGGIQNKNPHFSKTFKIQGICHYEIIEMLEFVHFKNLILQITFLFQYGLKVP